jgi:hypothetical protein
VLTIEDDDRAGTLQFSASTYSVTERNGAVTITVTRSGGGSGSVSVRYATSNGTASSGSDYTPASGTLVFGSGQTSKTFTVGIREDRRSEGDETVNLTLRNPAGGATLGTPRNAILTIRDDD